MKYKKSCNSYYPCFDCYLPSMIIAYVVSVFGNNGKFSAKVLSRNYLNVPKRCVLNCFRQPTKCLHEHVLKHACTYISVKNYRVELLPWLAIEFYVSSEGPSLRTMFTVHGDI